jgi:hypothetical protein
MQSPRSTVSLARQSFDTLRGTKVNRVAYGSGSAMTALLSLHAV